jgi:hypothetical protein
LAQHLANDPRTLYAGFDPTSLDLSAFVQGESALREAEALSAALFSGRSTETLVVPGAPPRGGVMADLEDVGAVVESAGATG